LSNMLLQVEKVR